MKLPRIQPIPSAFLVLLLTAALFVACDTEECPCPPPERVVISGMALDMPFATPLVGATIELITNKYDFQNPSYVRPSCECEADLCQYRTISNNEGHWAMEVPVEYTETWAPYNMLIKVSKGDGPPQYNMFQPAGTNPGTDVPELQGGTNQGDVQLLSESFYNMWTQDAIADGADPDALALLFGVAIGFVETGYPGVIDMIEGVTITATGGDPVEEFPVTYLAPPGLPDPDLTATSEMGVYFFVNPDANDDAAPMVGVYGEKPGSVFVNTSNAACPASTSSVAVINPYYIP